MDIINGNVQIEQKPDIKINTAEADLIKIIIVKLGGENQDQKGLVDFLYGLFYFLVIRKKYYHIFRTLINRSDKRRWLIC